MKKKEEIIKIMSKGPYAAERIQIRFTKSNVQLYRGNPIICTDRTRLGLQLRTPE